MSLLCSCRTPCAGLHDPFVCRVIPAALLWFCKRKSSDASFHMPPGIVDAVLTQTLKYSEEFESRGILLAFCEFVHENRDEFFEAVYRDQDVNFKPLFCRLSLK
jgi:hypothetical protein